ncbi:unnamed protein product [Brassica oleracea var. botrytis]
MPKDVKAPSASVSTNQIKYLNHLLGKSNKLQMS